MGPSPTIGGGIFNSLSNINRGKATLYAKLENMTIISRQRYTQDHYMNAPIKCNSGYPVFENVLQALYVLVYGVAHTLRYPRGYHVRTRFSDKMTSSEYSAHINNFYKSKSNYTPLRVTVTEDDDTGTHQHHAFVLNDKKDKKSSLQHIHAKLKKKRKTC